MTNDMALTLLSDRIFLLKLHIVGTVCEFFGYRR
jgi:hypothetical protein